MPFHSLIRSARIPLVILALTACVVSTGSVRESWAQANSEKKKIIEPRSVPAADGWPIHFTYYQSTLGKEAPVVILLHGKGGNQLVWQELAGILQDQGFAVIAADLRKHGKSVVDDAQGAGNIGQLRPNDYALMLHDVEAIKDFVFQEHQAERLNMRKLGLVAADMSAPVALNFALADWLKKPWPDAATVQASTPRGQDVRAIVLLSPERSSGRLQSATPVMQLRDPSWEIAFLTMVGQQDKLDKGTASSLHRQIESVARGEKKRVYFREYEVPLRGTDLLGKKIVEPIIAAFLIEHLKKLSDPWRDRQSRLVGGN